MITISVFFRMLNLSIQVSDSDGNTSSDFVMPVLTNLAAMIKTSHNVTLINRLRKALELNKDPAVAVILEQCLIMSIGLELYLERMCADETELQRKIHADTITEPWIDNFNKGLTMYKCSDKWLSSKHSTQFLKSILEIAKTERVLEIGMFTGYSTASFCSIECVKEVTGLELDPYIVEFVKTRFSGTEEETKLKIIQGDAMCSLSSLKESGQSFDAIFIDATKKDYMDYYKFIMDNNLIRSGGLLLVDNVLWLGKLYPEPQGENARYLYDFNEYVCKDSRVSQVILQIADGISLIRRK